MGLFHLMGNHIMLGNLLLINLILATFTMYDANSKEPIPYVHIVCVKHKESGIGGRDGKITLPLQPGEHEVRFHHIGYETHTLKYVTTGAQCEVVVLLQPLVLLGPIVEVVEKYIPQYYGMKVLDAGTLARNISVGEPDILRSLQQLPSMSTANDYATLPGIRGLSASYTHVYLGEAPVLNPFHLGGLFSAFDMGMVGDIEVYPGVAPVKFGDYGSGIIRLRPKFAPENETAIEVGMFSSKFRMLRSLGKHWQSGLSLRLFTLTPVVGIGYYFYDGHWTNHWSLKDILRLETNFYISAERLTNTAIDRGVLAEIEQTKPTWRNFIYSTKLQWKRLDLALYHTLSPLDMQTNRNWAHNKMFVEGVRFVFPWQIRNGKLETGGELQHSRLLYSWHFDDSGLEDIVGIPQNIFFDDAPAVFKQAFDYKTSTVFTEFSSFLRKDLNLKFGLRLQKFKDKIYSEPRANFGWQFKKWNVNFSYGLVHQFTYSLREKQYQEILTPFTVRFPANSHPIAIHTLQLSLQPRVSNLLLEIYVRRFHNILFYDWLTNDYYRSEGFSSGMEINYQGEFLKGQWQTSYVLATSRVAWRNHWLPTSQDRRHQLKFNADYPLDRTWRCGLQFHLATGYPYSQVSHWLPYYSGNIIFKGAPGGFVARRKQPNNARYPIYHRLDVQVEKDWHLIGGLLSSRLSVLNIYNQKNPFYYDVTYENYQPKVEGIRNFPIMPSLHFMFKF